MSDPLDEVDRILDQREARVAAQAKQEAHQDAEVADWEAEFDDWVRTVAMPTLEPFFQRLRARGLAVQLRRGPRDPAQQEGDGVELRAVDDHGIAAFVRVERHWLPRQVDFEQSASGGGMTQSRVELDEVTADALTAAVVDAMRDSFGST